MIIQGINYMAVTWSTIFVRLFKAGRAIYIDDLSD